jgi:hypothetical protein
MPWFGRAISRHRYVIGLAIRIAALAALTAGFPYLVYLVASTAGRGVSGAGGAIALVMGIYLKPLIYILFALSLLRPTARRAGTLGMSLVVGPVLALAIVGDLAFGTLFFNHWSVGFVAGAMRLPFPWLLTAALVAILTLAILSERDDGRTARERFGLAYPVWFALIALLALHGLVLVMTLVSLGFGVAPRRLMALAWVTNWIPRAPVAIALMVASLWLIVSDMFSGGASPRPTAEPSPRPRPPAGPVARGAPRAAFGLRRA